MTEAKIIETNESALRQFLTFTVAEEEYAVDLTTVREIKGWTETTRLPNAPAHMRGVINLRGSIIPIFDLRVRFGMDATVPHARNVVIILAVGQRDIGVLVDAVSDILTIAGQDIQSKPETQEGGAQPYVTGLISLENRMVVVLAVEQLFTHDISSAAA